MDPFAALLDIHQDPTSTPLHSRGRSRSDAGLFQPDPSLLLTTTAYPSDDLALPQNQLSAASMATIFYTGDVALDLSAHAAQHGHSHLFSLGSIARRAHSVSVLDTRSLSPSISPALSRLSFDYDELVPELFPSSSQTTGFTLKDDYDIFSESFSNYSPTSTVSNPAPSSWQQQQFASQAQSGQTHSSHSVAMEEIFSFNPLSTEHSSAKNQFASPVSPHKLITNALPSAPAAQFSFIPATPVTIPATPVVNNNPSSDFFAAAAAASSSAQTPSDYYASPAALSPDFSSSAQESVAGTPSFCNEQLTPRSATNSPGAGSEETVDYNGRRRRIYTKTQFACNHCPRKFSIKDMDEYARHVEEFNIQREFKCPEPSCPWAKIGFQRKLEKDRHFTRKHGVPKYECRFWAGPGKEKFPGAKVCTTQWHADSGNRTRHEKSVHGYFVKTHRGRASLLEEVEMIKIPRRVRSNSGN
ncbi:hypothetical protein BZA70DRAFT_281108 [Myxozyma melibiosi]|uniref:C2H2-type domain-containing protein n=1 Tax=Myxozyma melibiosi TaxID=54550 RepID=A0ABR1F3Y6_9ASCO